VIVISGALVVVALVLLVLGVTGPDLDLVYGSIAVSLLSLVFLVLGIIQRRGEVLPAAAGAAVTPVSETAAPAQQAAQTSTAALGVRSPAEEHHPEEHHPAGQHPAGQPAAGQDFGEPAVDGPVVDGPRAEASDDADLPADGLGESPGPDRAGSAPLPMIDEDTSGTVLVVANRPRYHVAGCRYLAGKAPESRDVSDAVAQGFSPCGVCKPDDVLRGASAPSDGLFPEPVPQARAPRVSASRPAPAPRPPAEQVVVVPDRNRYHRAECRHVRGLAGTESLRPAEAVSQGYSACGVCKP
jgi:hypothetical protein